MKLTQFVRKEDTVNVLEGLAHVCLAENSKLVDSVESFLEHHVHPDGVLLKSANGKNTISVHHYEATDDWMWEAYGQDMEELIDGGVIEQYDLYCDTMLELMNKLVKEHLSE